MLVEGVSDKVALETLALRRGRDLVAEGVSVLPIGGARAVGRFLNRYGRVAPTWGSRVSATRERRAFGRALERAGFGVDLGRAEMERLGFYVCEQDLEDELVRCLGLPWWRRSSPPMGSWGRFVPTRSSPRIEPERPRSSSWLPDQLEDPIRSAAGRGARSRPGTSPA